MKGLTLERIEKVTHGVLHVSVMTSAGIFAGFDRANIRKGSPRAHWIYERALVTEIDSIVTDSRKAGVGSLFSAIVGERVDGHTFIPKVYDQGAICVLAEHYLDREDLFSEEAVSKLSTIKAGASPVEDWKGGVKDTAHAKSLKELAAAERAAGVDVPGAAPDGSLYRLWIEVDDTEEALRAIAEEYLKILGVPVVGITGSVGKTSTKEMIASVLEQHFRTLKTEGNFNNGLGLPLTVFRLKEEDQIAVLEMGVSHFGDMDQLARIARPDTMVITNIGTCHLEFLKSRDGILKAKTEVFRYMDGSGHYLLNGNDDKLRTITSVNGVQPVFFGVSSDTEGAEDLCVGQKMDFPGSLDPARVVCATDVQSLGFEGSRCIMKTPEGDFEVKVPVPGLHNVSNAAAATAVGMTCGLTFAEIRKGIESMETISGRFRILKTEGKTIIDDCYNANPVSMKSSLAVLKEAGAEGAGAEKKQEAETGGKAAGKQKAEAGGAAARRVAVLGDMGELGEEEVLLHEQVGEYAADCCDHLIVIGELSKNLYEAARRKNSSLSAVWYPSVDEFLARKDEEIRGGDVVLVKASHFMGFSRIVEELTKA